jgi:hypothetical protein
MPINPILVEWIDTIDEIEAGTRFHVDDVVVKVTRKHDASLSTQYIHTSAELLHPIHTILLQESRIYGMEFYLSDLSREEVDESIQKGYALEHPNSHT